MASLRAENLTSITASAMFMPSAEVSLRLATIRRQYSIGRRVGTAIILSLLNLVNFFDRSIYGVVLPQITNSFNLTNSQAGLLQTVYVASLIVAAPFAGLIGRRFSRKWAIVIGSLAWAASAICGPMFNNGNFTFLCVVRAFGGLGESFLGTLAVTIFADLFNEKYRPLILNIYMGGIMLGGALAYLIGPTIAQEMAGVLDFKGWVWATAGAGMVGSVFAFFAMFIIPDIPMQKPAVAKRPSLWDDLSYLIRCRTYVCTVIGYTCFTFTLGAKQYWSVTFLTYASKINQDINLDAVIASIAIIVLVCGWMGAIGTAECARLLKNRGFAAAQPTITGFIGMFTGLAILGFIMTVLYSVPISLVFYGLTNITISCWVGTTQDILMAVLPPYARPMGAAIATLCAHLLGDGFSPSIVGALSDVYKSGKDDTYINDFDSMKFAFYFAEFIATMAGAMYIVAALSLRKDLEKVKKVNRRRKTIEQHNEDLRTEDQPLVRSHRSNTEDPFVPLGQDDQEESDSEREHSVKR